MARTVPKNMSATTGDEATASAPKVDVAELAAEEAETHHAPKKTIDDHKKGSFVEAVATSGAVAVPIQQYRVVNGGHIMYAQCRVVIRAGKLVDEHMYDLDLLRKQGIVLAEVPQT
jgi:hypothetical protein